MGGAKHAHRVAHHVAGDRDVPGERLHRQHVGTGGCLPDGRNVAAGGAIHDLQQLALGRERHVDLEEEAVQLGLRERVGAFHLEGVLGGEHEERFREGVLLLRDGDSVLLHRLEEGALRLGRGAIDLVGKHQVGEDRSGLEAEASLAALLDDDVGARARRLGHRPHQHGLAQSWHALEECVRSSQEADQSQPHELLLPNDEAPDLRLDGVGQLAEPLRRDAVEGWRWRGRLGLGHRSTPWVRGG